MASTGWFIENNEKEKHVNNSDIVNNANVRLVKDHLSGDGIIFTVDENLSSPEPLKNQPKLTSTNLKNYSSHIIFKKYKDASYITNSALLKNNTNLLVLPPLENGFIGSAVTAYDNHLHLSLSPDQIWIAITTAFAHFIDKHPEEMRSYFVNHEGQETLKVIIDNLNENSPEYYIEGIQKLYFEIDKKTKNDSAKLFECNFSTTTDTDRIISKVVLMGAMKHYFKYIMETRCGIPSIWLRGTLNDWKEIRSRVERIAEYGQNSNNADLESLIEWSRVLCFILDEFVNAFEKRTINFDFWTRIVSKFSTRGSGGADFLTGWILAFNPFNESGSYRLNSFDKISKKLDFGSIKEKYIIQSAVEVPFIQQGPGGNTPRNMLLYAGSLLCEYNSHEESVSPSNHWTLFQLDE